LGYRGTLAEGPGAVESELSGPSFSWAG